MTVNRFKQHFFSFAAEMADPYKKVVHIIHKICTKIHVSCINGKSANKPSFCVNKFMCKR